jgi:hypothetical protein
MQIKGRSLDRRWSLAVLFLAFVLLGWPGWNLSAQEGTGGGTEAQRRLLEVRRRQVELSAGRAEFLRTQQLFEKGLTSVAELDRARARLEQLQIEYQEAVLTLISLQPRVAIEEAVKYQDARGRQFVRLTIANVTPAFDDQQFKLLNNFEGAQPIPPELRTRDIRDVFVSLQDPGGEGVAAGTTIGLPYEQHVPELKYGTQRTLVFQLLRDVPSVVVAMSYLGQHSDLAIQLRQAGSGSAVNISSTQISQEADLGGRVTYPLRLERSSVDVRSFGLFLLGLPHQVNYNFIDPGTQARLSQLNFPAGVTLQNLQLQLFLPDQPSPEVVIDRPLDFWVVAAEAGRQLDLPPNGPVSREALARSGAGFLRLTLIPRGTGQIDVTARSLFAEIQVGQTAASTLTVRNTGTRRLDNIRLRADSPTGWKVTFTPAQIASLGLHEEITAQMAIQPPADVAVGDYEVRIKTECYAYDRRVPSEDKVFRVSVTPKSSSLLLGLLLGVLALGVTGGVVAAIRLTRR